MYANTQIQMPFLAESSGIHEKVQLPLAAPKSPEI
jgi:hypothetical protein